MSHCNARGEFLAVMAKAALTLAVAAMCGVIGSEAGEAVGAAWKHPLVKKGKLDSPLVYSTGGDQHFAGDLQLAEYEGTPGALFQEFFAGATVEASSADAIHSVEKGDLDDAVAWLGKEAPRPLPKRRILGDAHRLVCVHA